MFLSIYDIRSRKLHPILLKNNNIHPILQGSTRIVSAQFCSCKFKFLQKCLDVVKIELIPECIFYIHHIFLILYPLAYVHPTFSFYIYPIPNSMYICTSYIHSITLTFHNPKYHLYLPIFISYIPYSFHNPNPKYFSIKQNGSK